MAKRDDNVIAAHETLEDSAVKITKAAGVLLRRVEELEALTAAQATELTDVKGRLKVFEDKMKAVKAELA